MTCELKSIFAEFFIIIINSFVFVCELLLLQSKAAAFSRMNSTSQQSQTVSKSRVIQSSVQTSSHHSNETQSSLNKQSSTQLKSNLSEMQARMSQMKSLSQQTTTSSSSSSSSSSSTLVNTSSHSGTNSLSSHPNLKLITDCKGNKYHIIYLGYYYVMSKHRTIKDVVLLLQVKIIMTLHWILEPYSFKKFLFLPLVN